jgi:hypothetical protein
VLSYEPTEVDAWTKAFNSLFAIYGYDGRSRRANLNVVSVTSRVTGH